MRRGRCVVCRRVFVAARCNPVIHHAHCPLFTPQPFRQWVAQWYVRLRSLFSNKDER